MAKLFSTVEHRGCSPISEPDLLCQQVLRFRDSSSMCLRSHSRIGFLVTNDPMGAPARRQSPRNGCVVDGSSVGGRVRLPVCLGRARKLVALTQKVCHNPKGWVRRGTVPRPKTPQQGAQPERRIGWILLAMVPGRRRVTLVVGVRHTCRSPRSGGATSDLSRGFQPAES